MNSAQEKRIVREFLRALKKTSKHLNLDINGSISFYLIILKDYQSIIPKKIKNPVWAKGKFMGTIDKIKDIINKYLPDTESNVKFIKGY